MQHVHSHLRTIGIALCNLVVTTTMIPAQQKDGTAKPARRSLRSIGEIGWMDREQNMTGQLRANMGSSKDDQIQP